MRILGLFLLCAVAVSAQTNKGGISGTVVDPNGAVVPGATVTITNVGTNKSLTLTTSDSGSYTANSLEPVVYNVLVEVKGFKKELVRNVKVDTATTATVNVTLEPGTVAEQVVVTAEAPLINTESGTPSQTITERQIVEMPLNNRSVLDLVMTAPGVTGVAGSEDPELDSGDIPAPGFNVNVNGGRAGSTSILADGASNTGVGLGRAVVTFSPDTIQEFTVLRSNFSAEFGQTGGGVVSTITANWTVAAACIAMAIASGLCGLGQGRATASATEALARNPAAGGAIQTALILGLALIESLALYTLLIVFIKVK